VNTVQCHLHVGWRDTGVINAFPFLPVFQWNTRPLPSHRASTLREWHGRHGYVPHVSAACQLS
jgi:hypothetical protein